MVLSNSNYDDNDNYTGDANGVLSISGGGGISVTATAASIKLRVQSNLIVKDASNSIVIQYPASDFNDYLTENATFDTQNDAWKLNDNYTSYELDNSDTVFTDLKIFIPEVDLRDYYATEMGVGGDRATSTAVQGNPVINFFKDFVDEFQEVFLGTNGVGELLFTDETLGSTEFDSDQLRNIIAHNHSTPFFSHFLGSGPGSGDGTHYYEKTENASMTGSGSGNTITGFTYTPIHIDGVNRALRKMADHGYNGRDVNYNLGEDPFLVGDVICVENGLTLEANVSIEDEASESVNNLEINDLTSKTRQYPLFVVLV